MGLSIEEIKELILQPKNKKAITKAIHHQNRLRFHAELEVSTTLGQPLTDFLTFVSNLLPEDKFNIFKTLFRYPVKTNSVTATCFDKLSKIFEGQNPVFNYQFLNSEDRDDWEYYRQEVLNEPDVWKNKGWEHFKTDINSILVVDMQEEVMEKPEPYFYWLPICDVLTYDTKKGKIEWIIFRQKDNVVVLDDESYRVFDYKNNVIGEEKVNNPHDLGYCPASFFWSDSISLDDKDVKVSPLTKELEALDWFLFYHISKKHLDMYGAYPIYSGYEQSCDYINAESDFCENGFIKDHQGLYKQDSSGLLMKCPKCSNKSIVGVGSFVEIPVPNDENQADLRNPVQMLTVDRNSLDYNVAEEERLRNAIITSVVGTNEDIQAKNAINEQQVQANFESQLTVLNRVKKGFEQAQKFVTDTICKLRYGTSYVSCNINYGTEFYILDSAELRERYKLAKEAGASEAELDGLYTQIIEAEYRTNPLQLQRMLILAELEPYRHLTREEVQIFYDKGVISDEDLLIKLNFANFVRRFERENINIIEFGAAIDYDKKINIINQKLKDYANEQTINAQRNQSVNGSEV